ncbi:MAG: NADH-quinone oxidoreductase subunit H [Actinobacteria bacterium]|nr:NADH-quinone oxidoreductase subunit H [Actinomycetota bacterium]
MATDADRDVDGIDEDAVSWSDPLPAVLLVGAVLVAGAYATSVLDTAAAHLVAGRRLRLGELVLGPWREAALLAHMRRSTTERPDVQTWALAPALLAGMAAVAVATVPLAPGVAVADVADGIVLFGAAMALVMVGVYLHGWSSNSVFPLVGGYRFVALALSYEMPLALVLIAAALPAESLSVGAIVESQQGLWNVVRQPLGLPLFLVAGMGLASWGPLGMSDGTDLAGGTSAESSGGARLVWALARRFVLVAVAVTGAAVFLGGWHGPVLAGGLWMALKTLVLLAVLVGVGHRVARIRLERFVVVAWAVLIPLALIDVFVSGALVL